MPNPERLPPGQLPRSRAGHVDVRGLTARQIALLNALADEWRPQWPDDPAVLTREGAELVRFTEDHLRREAGELE